MDANGQTTPAHIVTTGKPHPLLSAEEELALATVVQTRAALHARWIAGDLTVVEYTRLRREADAARERMVQCNLRLVLRIARLYRNRGALLEDLVNEGNLALIKAVDRFDPAKGLRFSTFAAHWISYAIRHVLREAPLKLRLPAYLHDEIHRMRLAKQEFEQANGRPPSLTELAQSMQLSVRRIENVALATWVCAHAIDPRDRSDPESIIASLPDKRNPAPGEPADSEDEVGLVLSVLPRLTGRESQILKMHFGLGERDGRSMTLREIGVELGLSHERVRQIEKNARAKLERYMGEHL